jgi:L,D-peptidoglycan transpeptidase YkuD (ErfK/YbiS/YcfS/YnhG family)
MRSPAAGRAGAAARRLTTLGVVVTLALLAAGHAGPAGAAARHGAHASAGGTPGQMIRVTTASYHTTYARFTAYRRSGGSWVRVFGPWQARIGYNGLAPPGKKREGDGRTPSGSYGFSFFFGVKPNPGVSFKYRHAYSYDVWDDDPASPRYNEWVDTRRHDAGASPEPMHQVPAYNYSAVMTYNAGRVPGLGSAIFLHVGTGSATAGCVSLPERELLKVLRWLRPGRSPQIRLHVR